MTDSTEDLAVITTLLERFTQQRLPRLREIKARVDVGEKLDDRDLQFLEMMLADANKVAPRIRAHPELDELVGKAVNLYHEITTRALENEKAS